MMITTIKKTAIYTSLLLVVFFSSLLAQSDNILDQKNELEKI